MRKRALKQPCLPTRRRHYFTRYGKADNADSCIHCGAPNIRKVIKHLLPVLERFASFVRPDPGTGCLLWTGSTVGTLGYGKFWWNGREERAHRVAWLLAGREIPAGMQILHTCDVAGCVNIEHLIIGTDADNHRDRALKGRVRRSISGLPFGVRMSRHGRFQAVVWMNGKDRYLGSFATVDEAASVADAARRSRYATQ